MCRWRCGGIADVVACAYRGEHAENVRLASCMHSLHTLNPKPETIAKMAELKRKSNDGNANDDEQGGEGGKRQRKATNFLDARILCTPQYVTKDAKDAAKHAGKDAAKHDDHVPVARSFPASGSLLSDAVCSMVVDAAKYTEMQKEIEELRHVHSGAVVELRCQSVEMQVLKEKLKLQEKQIKDEQKAKFVEWKKRMDFEHAQLLQQVKDLEHDVNVQCAKTATCQLSLATAEDNLAKTQQELVLSKKLRADAQKKLGCGRDGRRRMAALVNSRDATRLLGSTSLRRNAVGSRGASSHAHLFWARMRGESGCAEGAHGVVATARPTTRRLQSIPCDPHAMEAGTARLRGRPHRMLRARVVLDRSAAWTRLGVHVARGLQPRGQLRAGGIL